jgi:glucans biosynthesis protein
MRAGQGPIKNMKINLMDQDRLTKQLENIRAAPRCGAKTRAGTPCRCPAVSGRTRCRIHGGRSPGAPRGKGNGNFKDGYWTAEAVEERRWVKDMLQLYAKGTDE